MLSYPTATGYRDAFRKASEDHRWNLAEMRHLKSIAEDEENSGVPVGGGRSFRHGKMRFWAHYATEGVNIGRGY